MLTKYSSLEIDSNTDRGFRRNSGKAFHTRTPRQPKTQLLCIFIRLPSSKEQKFSHEVVVQKHREKEISTPAAHCLSERQGDAKNDCKGKIQFSHVVAQWP